MREMTDEKFSELASKIEARNWVRDYDLTRADALVRVNKDLLAEVRAFASILRKTQTEWINQAMVEYLWSCDAYIEKVKAEAKKKVRKQVAADRARGRSRSSKV